MTVLAGEKNARQLTEQTPHCLACSIPTISTILKTSGAPRARHAPPGVSVASNKILARSSSEKVPSSRRVRLWADSHRSVHWVSNARECEIRTQQKHVCGVQAQVY